MPSAHTVLVVSFSRNSVIAEKHLCCQTSDPESWHLIERNTSSFDSVVFSNPLRRDGKIRWLEELAHVETPVYATSATAKASRIWHPDSTSATEHSIRITSNSRNDALCSVVQECSVILIGQQR